MFEDLDDAPSDVRAIRIDRNVKNVARIDRFTKLEQIHLIDPTPDQVTAVFRQNQIRRLLFGDAHKFSLDGIENLTSLEELAFLNSSGPNDLNVLASLPKLRSLMLENLRGLQDWSSIGRVKTLRCFCLTGGFVEATTKISTLDYLRDLTELEHIYIAGVKYSGAQPAFEGLRHCKKLVSAVIVPGCFSLEDNAYLEAHLAGSVRYFKKLFQVNGKGNAMATSREEAENLPAHEILDKPEGRLSWMPLVQFQKGRSFTRTYTGDRSKVLARMTEFEECYANALEVAKKAGINDHKATT